MRLFDETPTQYLFTVTLDVRYNLLWKVWALAADGEFEEEDDYLGAETVRNDGNNNGVVEVVVVVVVEEEDRRRYQG